MKNITKRKVVLNSIAAFAGVMLLIGLCFTVVAFPIGISASTAISANGFELLGFEFPVLLQTMMTSVFRKEAFYTAFGIIFGALSLLSLIVAIGGLILNVVSIFTFNEKKAEKYAKLTVVLCCVLPLLYTISAIIFVAVLNSSASLELYDVSFSTFVFISEIIQIALFVAFVISFQKVKTVQCASTNARATEKTEKGKNTAKQDVCHAEKLINALESEKSAIKLLIEYKSLYDNGVLSSSDYADKKVAIFRFVKQRLYTEISVLAARCSITDAVKAETQILEILKEYRKLYDDGEISDADYADKKGDLLSSIIS